MVSSKSPFIAVYRGPQLPVSSKRSNWVSTWPTKRWFVVRLRLLRRSMVSGKASMSNQSVATLPLSNKHVLVTRTREQASVMSEKLRSLGAVPVEFPTIRIVPPQDWGQLDAALRRLYTPTGSDYSWLVFTSVNGVNICCERLRALGYDPQAMRDVHIAAIG